MFETLVAGAIGAAPPRKSAHSLVVTEGAVAFAAQPAAETSDSVITTIGDAV